MRYNRNLLWLSLYNWRIRSMCTTQSTSKLDVLENGGMNVNQRLNIIHELVRDNSFVLDYRVQNALIELKNGFSDAKYNDSDILKVVEILYDLSDEEGLMTILPNFIYDLSFMPCDIVTKILRMYTIAFTPGSPLIKTLHGNLIEYIKDEQNLFNLDDILTCILCTFDELDSDYIEEILRKYLSNEINCITYHDSIKTSLTALRIYYRLKKVIDGFILHSVSVLQKNLDSLKVPETVIRYICLLWNLAKREGLHVNLGLWEVWKSVENFKITLKSCINFLKCVGDRNDLKYEIINYIIPNVSKLSKNELINLIKALGKNNHYVMPINFQSKLTSIEYPPYTLAVEASPLEVQSNYDPTRRGASSNYLSLKSRATPGDRGEVSDGSSIMGMMEDGAKDVLDVTSSGMKSSTGPQVETSTGVLDSDLRELEGEVNEVGSTAVGTEVVIDGTSIQDCDRIHGTSFSIIGDYRKEINSSIHYDFPHLLESQCLLYITEFEGPEIYSILFYYSNVGNISKILLYQLRDKFLSNIKNMLPMDISRSMLIFKDFGISDYSLYKFFLKYVRENVISMDPMNLSYTLYTFKVLKYPPPLNCVKNIIQRDIKKFNLTDLIQCLYACTHTSSISDNKIYCFNNMENNIIKGISSELFQTFVNSIEVKLSTEMNLKQLITLALCLKNFKRQPFMSTLYSIIYAKIPLMNNQQLTTVWMTYSYTHLNIQNFTTKINHYINYQELDQQCISNLLRVIRNGKGTEKLKRYIEHCNISPADRFEIFNTITHVNKLSDEDVVTCVLALGNKHQNVQLNILARQLYNRLIKILPFLSFKMLNKVSSSISDYGYTKPKVNRIISNLILKKNKFEKAHKIDTNIYNFFRPISKGPPHIKLDS